MDHRTMHLSALLRDGWLVIALLTLLPDFAAGNAPSGALAISAGGILLAMRAFDEISVFFQQISLAAASFEQIRELLRAVVRPERESKAAVGDEAAKLTDEAAG